MNIAMLSPEIYPCVTAGLEIFNYYLIKELAERGHKVLIFTTCEHDWDNKNISVVKLRKTFFRFYKNPLNIFKRLHFQSVMIIQPVDFLEDGRQNMCDGCPDITVYKDELIWSCRMEEQKQYDTWLRTVPKI